MRTTLSIDAMSAIVCIDVHRTGFSLLSILVYATASKIEEIFTCYRNYTKLAILALDAYLEDSKEISVNFASSEIRSGELWGFSLMLSLLS